jgi:hypothetical protein
VKAFEKIHSMLAFLTCISTLSFGNTERGGAGFRIERKCPDLDDVRDYSMKHLGILTVHT